VNELRFWLAKAFILGLTNCLWAATLAPDWQGREPHFPPGSLFWRTSEFKTAPILYRTVLPEFRKPIEFAVVRVRARRYAYLFVTRFNRFSDLDPFGQCIARSESPKERPDEEVALLADLAPSLLPQRPLALLVSAPESGFQLEGIIAFRDGTFLSLASTPDRWRAQKFPPLTVLEFEPCMRPDFDDRHWFPTRVVQSAEIWEPAKLMAEFRTFAERTRCQRLQRQLEEVRWRLTLLRDKGIVIVDDEAFGWGGAERLPSWLRERANILLQSLAKGADFPETRAEFFAKMAEVLSVFVWVRDEVTNVANHALLWRALRQPDRAAHCEQVAKSVEGELNRLEVALRGLEARFPLEELLERLLPLRRQLLGLRDKSVHRAFVVNDLNSGLENKFGWFDTTVLLDNDVTRWGLRVTTSATVFASPLSPAAFVTVPGTEFTLSGWDELKPWRVYNKPANPGPVCAWVVLGGKVVNRRPQPDGTVYERERHGRWSENWMLLVPDLSRGGGLPVQLVFLRHPNKILFRSNEQGIVREVTVLFEQPGAQLFMLKPLKEWRGLLYQARAMTRSPLNEQEVASSLQQCRLWSRAVLCYPVTFSEAFVRDPNSPYALLVANAYNYWEFRDEWNTPPLKLAPLPPLASYGLLKGYPGLQVISEAAELGSWGVWGDHIAVVGREVIVYGVPIHPIQRFGGFTAFCFGPTDIGVLGNLTELDLIKRTGANSFRPQHNRVDEAAMQLVKWCVEHGVQHVFNTDEKWVPDIVAHYRRLAELCQDLPAEAVAYDLLNEPETREPRAYNALLRRLTRAIRSIDKSHLIYAEVVAPWGPMAQPYPEAAFANLEPTGDPLTVYSFHDYEYRLMTRYPNEKVDIRNLLERWLPVFRFSIDHRAPIHLGEFGAFEQTPEDIYANRCAITMLLDYFRLFDRFGWHFHYYSNRGIVRVRRDGSLEESLVQEAFRRYFGRYRLNAVRE